MQAKIEQPTAEVVIGTEKREAPKVVNIMDALKKSMQARGQAKVRDAVRRDMGKTATWVKKEPVSEDGACIEECQANSGR